MRTVMRIVHDVYMCCYARYQSMLRVLSMDKRMRVSNACNMDFRLLMVLGEEMLIHCIYLALYLGHT